MENNPQPSSSIGTERSLQYRALGVALSLLLSAAAGVGAYVVLFTQVLLPANLVPHEVARTVARAELLRDLAEQPERPILIFGSSVVLEGVDAQIVEGQLPGSIPVYNIAESSAGLRNLMMNMPLIRPVHPRWLVCCLRRSQLAHDYFPDLPSELLIGYAYAGYVNSADHQPPWIFDRLKPRELDALPGHTLERLLASRVFLLRAVEQKLRHSNRPDLRSEGFSSNFRNPWRYTRQIPPDRLDMLIARSHESFADLRFDPSAPISDVLKACLRRCADESINFLLVLTPENPLIQAGIPPETLAAFDEAVAAMVRQGGARQFTLSAELFTPEDFLDHAHVNARGREIFSRKLGSVLARLLEH